MSSHAISSSKQRLPANYPVPTALGKNAPNTLTSNSSKESWMSVSNTGHVPSVSIFLANRSCIPTSWTQSSILKKHKKEIQSFLQRMGSYLTNSQTPSWNLEWTELSGAGGKTTLMITLSESLEKSEWLGSSSKKRRKRNLKSGRRSRGSK